MNWHVDDKTDTGDGSSRILARCCVIDLSITDFCLHSLSSFSHQFTHLEFALEEETFAFVSFMAMILVARSTPYVELWYLKSVLKKQDG